MWFLSQKEQSGGLVFSKTNHLKNKGTVYFVVLGKIN